MKLGADAACVSREGCQRPTVLGQWLQAALDFLKTARTFRATNFKALPLVPANQTEMTVAAKVQRGAILAAQEGP
jgi:hypothetical protein